MDDRARRAHVARQNRLTILLLANKARINRGLAPLTPRAAGSADTTNYDYRGGWGPGRGGVGTGTGGYGVGAGGGGGGGDAGGGGRIIGSVTGATVRLVDNVLKLNIFTGPRQLRKAIEEAEIAPEVRKMVGEAVARGVEKAENEYVIRGITDRAINKGILWGDGKLGAPLPWETETVKEKRETLAETWRRNQEVENLINRYTTPRPEVGGGGVGGSMARATGAVTDFIKGAVDTATSIIPGVANARLTGAFNESAPPIPM